VSRIAVIGSGISGLAAAYYLSRKHDVFLFEREARLGGHTHTVTVESSRGPLAVDTGFIVHNDRTYPNLIKLLSEHGVPRVSSDMSFAVSCRKSGYEYSRMYVAWDSTSASSACGISIWAGAKAPSASATSMSPNWSSPKTGCSVPFSAILHLQQRRCPPAPCPRKRRAISFRGLRWCGRG
jgi:protoporphyrinogen oxidase